MGNLITNLQDKLCVNVARNSQPVCCDRHWYNTHARLRLGASTFVMYVQWRLRAQASDVVFGGTHVVVRLPAEHFGPL